jgi:replicative DNA helicase
MSRSSVFRSFPAQTKRGRTKGRCSRDLRESGAIEQDADVVIGLYREGYYNKECENPNEAEAIILKNRHGETGTFPLLWIPEYTTFASMEKRRGE